MKCRLIVLMMMMLVLSRELKGRRRQAEGACPSVSVRVGLERSCEGDVGQ